MSSYSCYQGMKFWAAKTPSMIAMVGIARGQIQVNQEDLSQVSQNGRRDYPRQPTNQHNKMMLCFIFFFFSNLFLESNQQNCLGELARLDRSPSRVDHVNSIRLAQVTQLGDLPSQLSFFFLLIMRQGSHLREGQQLVLWLQESPVEDQPVP